MIREWISNAAITLDPFDSFLQWEQCIHLLLTQTTKDTNLDAVIDAVMCCPTPEAGVFYLDVCHRIYKDGRKHIDDHSHPVYGLLSSFSRTSNGSLQEWLKQRLQSTDEKQLVPTLVWMIDVLKLSTMADEGAEVWAMVSCDQHWLSVLIDLWYHPHITVVRRSMELVHRWMAQQKNVQLQDVDAIKKLMSYIDLCKRTLSPSQLARLQDHDRTDFFYQPIALPSSLTLDRECLNWLIQIVVASIRKLVQQPDEIHQLPTLLETTLYPFMASFEGSLSSPRPLLEFISNICGSNDQVMIQLQLDVLEIHFCLDQHAGNDEFTATTPSLSASSLPTLLSPLISQINPHTLFVYFLYRTGMDHELVIDLLMSDETDMLLYLTRYLKYVERHPHDFITAIEQVLADEGSNYGGDDDDDDDDDDDGISTVLGLLYQVWVVVRSDVFPYNASVLARRIYSVMECLKQALIE
ncbi:hypothetical protein [Absidia glauca]|uniref:Protein Lines N-terminal domain-containing protein n=1 Tax=Absidia glauca TaxID=4829 RepID=A0A163ITZ2_ABSGL|nr:hypothetical protein [Absidia glauca]